jgi:hypothetical protein
MPALTVRGACFAAGLAFCLGIAHSSNRIQISVGDKAVLIMAENVSLRDVLEELSRQTTLLILSQQALDEMVTVDIDENSLQAAIRRLLRQKSYMLHQLNYDLNRPRGTPYSRLWIFSDDPGNGFWATHAPSELTDYHRLALSEKGGDREEAMYGFAELGGSSVVGYLQQGLSDRDERVRDAAIESLIELGGTASIQALSTTLNHPDAGTRIDTVDALGEIGGPEAITLLQSAMGDENDTVREAAAEWLTELAWQYD